MRTPRKVLAAGALLLVATFAVYLPALRNGYVWDDRQYIVGNAHVAGGLSAAGLRWALTSFDAGNWHPLTWASHMLDATLFGGAPAGPHLVNLLLHLANTGLVFALFRGLTGEAWRSLLLAALFALHPLRVESVAWAAERKDVLAATFGLLAACAYVRHARRPSPVRFLAVAALFLLGLAAKTTVITLPALLLLLDWWPLGRLRATRGALLEKLLLLVVAAGPAAATVLAQRAGGGLVSLGDLPPGARVGNALLSLAAYVRETAWPSGLSAFVPHPGPGLSWAAAALAGAALAAVTVAALRVRRRLPYAIVGWLWFLVALLPVIGLVQVGLQARADRYTYLPAAGLLLVAAWGAADVGRRFPGARPALASFGCAAIAGLGAATFVQAGVWRDDATLFRHALRVDPGNWYAHYMLGVREQELGRTADAEAHYRAAIGARPFEKALNNLGAILAARGDSAGAEALFLQAIARRPDYAAAYGNLAGEYRRRGRWPEAETCYLRAIGLEPGAVEHRFNLGALLLQEARYREAAGRFAEALRLDPRDADAEKGLRAALLLQGRLAKP